MGDMSQRLWYGNENMMTADSDRGPMQGIPASPIASTGSGPDAAEIIAIIERHQVRQRDLCRSLEAIADSLPLDVDPSLCMRLARTLLPVLQSAHDYKERYFCSLAREALHDMGNLDPILERLRAEFRENELLAEEVAEELSQWGVCAAPKNPETVGYMLRGFFISLTRHLDFEKVVLVDPIKSRLFHPEGG